MFANLRNAVLIVAALLIAYVSPVAAAATGLVTVRFDMPAGYKIPPHFHPTDEHITVLKGSFSLGMGDVIDETHATTLLAGGYGVAMAGMHHYAAKRRTPGVDYGHCGAGRELLSGTIR
jgi:hypothetical protein